MAIFSFFFLSRPYASAAAVGSLMMRADLEARDLAGFLGRLALRVVEVRGHGDHGFRHLLAEVVLGVFFRSRRIMRRDLGRRVALAVDLDLDEFVRARRRPCRERASLRSRPRCDAGP